MALLLQTDWSHSGLILSQVMAKPFAFDSANQERHGLRKYAMIRVSPRS
jgi:hypothetical protein